MKHLLSFNESSRFSVLSNCIHQIDDHCTDLIDAGEFQFSWGQMPTAKSHPTFANFDECGLDDFLIKRTSLGKSVMYLKITWSELDSKKRQSLVDAIYSIKDSILQEDLIIEGFWYKSGANKNVKSFPKFQYVEFRELLDAIYLDLTSDIRISFSCPEILQEYAKTYSGQNGELLEEIKSILQSELDYYEWDIHFDVRGEVLIWYNIRGVSEYIQGNIDYDEIYNDRRTLSGDVLDEFHHLVSFMKSEDYQCKITLVRENFMESDDLLLSGLQELEGVALNDETLIYFEFTKS